jgi:hypothetical protein
MKRIEKSIVPDHVHVFLYYDQPLLSAVKLGDGQLYLEWVWDGPNDPWLYVPVTAAQVEDLKASRLSSRDVLMQDRLYLAEHAPSGAISAVYELSSAELDPSLLPKANAYLKAKDDRPGFAG